MVKTLKFGKRTKNMDKNPEFMCNVIQCGNDKFTLKDYKRQHGHDDSLPYYAILCMNGTPLCSCTNDGWGGMTDMKPLSDNFNSVMEEVGKYKWSYKQMVLDLSLDFIADILAQTADLCVK